MVTYDSWLLRFAKQYEKERALHKTQCLCCTISPGLEAAMKMRKGKLWANTDESIRVN